MPPKNASTTAASRKGPQFKPPRPVKASTSGTSGAKRGTTGAAKKTAGSTAQNPATIISSDEEADEEVDEQYDDDDDLMEDISAQDTRPAISSMASPIPTPLLTRLLHEHFEDPNTQIQKGAMNLVSKYMEIFVREAFARAKQEREMSVKAGGISDGFLQVEDLEKLAPQLILDF